MENSSNNYTLSESVEGGAVAAFVGVEFILSLTINLFICIHTCMNGRKSMQKSSTIFLFNLALINLMTTVLYMPFVIIASGAEEWIFGRTDAARRVLCQINGYIFAFTTTISVHTISAISVDRFLFIVKPQLHKRFMTWKTSLAILAVIWAQSFLINLTPLFGFGEFDWSGSIGGCLPVWVGNRGYVIFFSSLGLIPLTTITVTSVWTFIFTRGYLRRHLREERAQSLSLKRKNSGETQNSIYSEKIRNLFGVFGLLLLFNILTSLPYISASVIGLIIGLENIPDQVYTTVFIMFLLSNVTNSIIQAYFRKELLDAVKDLCRKVCFCCMKEQKFETSIVSRSHYAHSNSESHAALNRHTDGITQNKVNGSAKVVTLVAHNEKTLSGNDNGHQSQETLLSALDGVSNGHVTNSNDHVTISLDGGVATPNTSHVTLADNDDHVTTITVLVQECDETSLDEDETCGSSSSKSQLENGGSIEEAEVEE